MDLSCCKAGQDSGSHDAARSKNFRCVSRTVTVGIRVQLFDDLSWWDDFSRVCGSMKCLSGRGALFVALLLISDRGACRFDTLSSSDTWECVVLPNQCTLSSWDCLRRSAFQKLYKGPWWTSVSDEAVFDVAGLLLGTSCGSFCRQQVGEG